MDIDNLQIEIQGTAKSASSTIDTLCRKIDKLSVSLNQLDGSRVIAFASGIKALNNAAQGLNNIKTPDFTRLAKNLTAMNNLNLSNLSNISTNMNQLASSMNGLTGLSNSAQQVTEFTKSLSALGNKSATNAISNLPNLATAMNDFITKMSKVPKVSQNTIDLTNALARLARTGASSGRAANSLSTAFDGMNRSSRLAYGGITKLNVGIGSLRGLLGKLAPIIGMISLVDLGKQAIDTASQLTEVQNVVDTTFGNYSQMVEDMAKTSIQDYGMSELTVKKISSRFQAMGTAMGFPQKQMAGMSVELTKLAGDMASFYDVSQEDVAKSLQSVFTGETEPVRKFGLDVTNATLKQWALNNGLNANISSMSQAEKAMLRYQYVMSQTTASQGDFAKTSNTWANLVRILAENFKALGSIVGNVLINAFKPVIQFLNKVVVAVTSAVETIANALGAIFGWTVEVSPGGQTLDDTASGMDDIGTSADNAGNSMGNAAKNAKKLKDALMGFDEIEKLPDPTSSSSGGSGNKGNGSGSGSGSAGTAQIVKTDSIFEKYKSDIKSLEELGSWIGDSLSKAMESIDWESIYNKARNFGKGLANFLNGLISPRLFGNVGRTIANSLNTAFEFLNSFGETFDWNNFGRSIGVGITSFFMNWKPKLAASTFNTWANGILDTMIKAMDTTDWEAIGRQIGIFLAGIDYKGILAKIGRLIWEAIKAAVETFKGMFGTTAGNVEATIVAAILALKFAKIGYSFGLNVWKKIGSSILGKSITTLYGKKIGDGVSQTLTDQIGKSVEKSMPGASKTIGEKLWSGLEKAASSPFGQAATYTAIAQLAIEVQKLTDKLKGGNGQLSEMGGIFDSLSTYYTPEFSKKLFQLKERLEDQGASSDVVKEKMTNLFKAAGISAESFETVLNDVAGSGTVTAEQMDILKGILKNLGDTSDTTAKKTENTKNSYKALKDKLVELQQQGIIPSQEHMDSLLNTLDKQQKSGATASQALKAVTKDMDTLGIRTSETAVKIDKTLGTAIDKTNKKGINVKAKVISDTKNLGKTLLNPITKLFKKNPFDVKTELKDKERDFQKKLDKFKKLFVNPEVKTNTSAKQLQNQLNSLNKGYTMTFPTKISTPASDLKNYVTNGFKGFTLGINAKANVTDKDTSKLNKNIDGFTGNISKKTMNGLNMLIGGFTGNISKKTMNGLNMLIGGFTGNVSKKTTSGLNMKIGGFTGNISSKSTDGLNKNIYGLVGHIAKFIYNNALGFIGKIFGWQKKDGGVYKNGKWSPIQAFANGGLPNQGQLFVAREAGPELVGRMPGGGTGVMNNNQIVSSVSDGVYRAVRAANASNNNSQPIQVTVVLDGDAKGIFRIVQQENNRIVTSTGQPALLT